MAADTHYEVPRVPASAGALLFDARSRVLAAVGSDGCLYLEDGRPVDAVRA